MSEISEVDWVAASVIKFSVVVRFSRSAVLSGLLFVSSVVATSVIYGVVERPLSGVVD